MPSQVVTIGYLKTFVSGILNVNSAYSDNTYCPTYSELTGGGIVTNYKADTNPTKTTNGIRINGCSVNTGYENNQLVVIDDLELLYQQLQSIDVSASNTSISCCSGSTTLSTTASFKLITKTNEGTTTGSTTTATVTASYSDNASYTTISGSKITFTKNSVNTSNCTGAAARTTTVTGSYTYSSTTKTDTVDITQNKNSIDTNWTNTSTSTNSISVSPSSMSFSSAGGTKSFTVTRYYTQYREKYDECDVAVCWDNYDTSSTVTPTNASVTGDFSCTKSSVSAEVNSGSDRSGTLTVTYGGYSDTCSISQGASQAGTINGEPYDYDYYVYVTVASSYVSCDGGTATFQAYYVTTWKYDWETKNDAGEVTNSGTSSDSSSTNVTSSAEWSTTLGSVSNGKLTLGAYDSDTRRTATVTAKYNGYSDSETAYQESCYDEPEDTGSTSCMNVKYTVESGINCTVYYKTTNGTQQAQHSVSKTGDQELCNIAEGTEIVVSCSDTGVTLTGDVSFTYQTGSDIYIGLNKKNSGGGGSSEVCMDVVITNEDSCTGDLLIKNASGVKISEYGIDQGNAVTFCYTKGETVYISMRDSDGTTATLTDGGTSFTVVEGGTVYVNITCDSSGGGGGSDTGTTFEPYYVFCVRKSGETFTTCQTEVTLDYSAEGNERINTITRSWYYTGSTETDYVKKSWTTVSNNTDWLTVTSEGGWQLTKNTSSESRSGSLTLTQEGSGKICTVYINQSGKSCVPSTTYDGFVYSVKKIEACDTSHKISMMNVGYDSVDASCNTTSGHVDITNDDVTITVTPTITKNETSEEKTYNYTIKGKGTYSAVTSSGSFTQKAGPCTPATPTAKTEITVTFTGTFEVIDTEGADSQYGCSGGYYDNPGQHVTMSDIQYTITGVDSVPDELRLIAQSQKYHLGKEHTGETSYKPSSLSGTLTTPSCNTQISSVICYQIEQSCSIISWHASLTDDSKYTLKIVDNVNKSSEEPEKPVEPEKPLVSQIFIRNNCPGTVNIEYTGPTGGKVYTSMTADSSGTFSLPMTGQTDVQVSIPRDCYQQSQSNFIYVEFLDGNGNTLPINASGNVRDEGGGAIAYPNLMGSGSSESSICTTTAKYQACATILFQAYN